MKVHFAVAVFVLIIVSLIQLGKPSPIPRMSCQAGQVDCYETELVDRRAEYLEDYKPVKVFNNTIDNLTHEMFKRPPADDPVGTPPPPE